MRQAGKVAAAAAVQRGTKPPYTSLLAARVGAPFRQRQALGKSGQERFFYDGFVGEDE